MLFNGPNVGLNYSDSMMNSSNETQTKGSVGCFKDASLLRVLGYVTILLISLAGNSMTVHIIRKGRLAKRNAHLFLLNMAVADLVITCVYMPRMVVMMLYGSQWLVGGTLGLTLCRLVPFLHHVSILVSVLSILGVTVDRFCAIMFPLKRVMTLKVARVAVVITWLLSGLARMPYLIAPKLTVRKNGEIACFSNFASLFGHYRDIYTKSLISLYCVSLLLTCILFILLISKLNRTKVPGASAQDSQAKKRQASRKLLHMLLVITICFILCWFVYFFAFDIFMRPLSCSIRFIRFFLAHSNSAINPIVLIVFNDRYRNGYKKLLCKCFSRCQARENDCSSSTLKLRLRNYSSV